MFNNISKRILIVFLILVCFLAAGANFSALADTARTSGDYKYIILEDSTAEITKYRGEATALEIPSTIDGYKVTSIVEGISNAVASPLYLVISAVESSRIMYS